MDKPDSLLDEIATLLAGPSGRDDPAVLERTLTDGYARALNLEAESSRLQKRIDALAATVERGDESSETELSTLVERLSVSEEDIDLLRPLLARLRSRYSAAAKSKAL